MAQFCGCVELVSETAEHKSRTCVVLGGTVSTTGRGLTKGDQVAVKLMHDKEQYEREINSRKKTGDGSELDTKYVVPVLCSSDEFGVRWGADAAQKLKYPEYDFGLIMPMGNRDLAVASLKERLDFSTIIAIMSQIACCLQYVHSVGIIHADVKLLVRSSFLSSHVMVC